MSEKRCCVGLGGKRNYRDCQLPKPQLLVSVTEKADVGCGGAFRDIICDVNAVCLWLQI